MATAVKKGAAEARAAMTELFAELDRTRKEYAKATLQLTHLETTVQHQRDAESRKDQAIAYLEAELQRREQSYRQDLQVLQEENRGKEAAWEHRTKFYEMELARLKQEVDASQHFEKENRQLRDAVLENQATVEKLQLVIEELKTRAKEDAREHAAQLEAEFKRRLADSEKKFRAEAYRALSDEAKIALQGNDQLQAVLHRQNDAIESILLKCKQLEQSHATLTGEQEIAAQNIQHHVAEVQRLKRQLTEAQTRNQQLDTALQQRKVERASLELLFIEYESTRKQLSKANDQARRAARECERWRHRAVQLTQELSADQQAGATAQLEAIAQQGEKLEVHMQRSRARANRRDRERDRNASGAAAYRGAVADPGADNDRWSVLDPAELIHRGANEDEVGDDGDYHSPPRLTQGASSNGGDTVSQDPKARLVNPTDVLRMWNARFAGGDSGASSRTASPGESGVVPVTDASEAAASPGSEGTPHLPPVLSDRAAVSRDTTDSNNGTTSAKRPMPVRPQPPNPQGLSVDEQIEARNRQLSVLSSSKHRSIPVSLAPRAKAGVPQVGGAGGLPPTLNVVEHGEFATMRIRGGPPALGQRFISP